MFASSVSTAEAFGLLITASNAASSASATVSTFSAAVMAASRVAAKSIPAPPPAVPSAAKSIPAPPSIPSARLASSSFLASSFSNFSALATGSPPTILVTARVAPPAKTADAPTSIYSSIASGLSMGRPA